METATISMCIAAAASMLLGFFVRNKWISIALPACIPALIALAPLAGSSGGQEPVELKELAVYLVLGLLFYLLVCAAFSWCGGALRKRWVDKRRAKADLDPGGEPG